MWIVNELKIEKGVVDASMEYITELQEYVMNM